MNFFFPEMLSDRRKSLTIFDCHKSPKLSRADKRRGSFAATLPSSPQDTPTTSGGGKGKRNLMSLSTDRRASFGAPSNGLGGGSGVAHAHKNERRGSYNPPHSGALVQEPIGKVERRGSLVQRWFQHISKAADKAKSRRPDPSPISGHEVDAASSGDSPHSKTKETEESHSQNLSVPSNSSSVQSAQLNGPSVSSPDLITSKLDTSTPEPVRLTIEEAHLVDPALVTVSHQPVFFAEPVLTPLERLRRKDDMIKQALAEKQQLVADILQVPREEFDTIADLAGEPAHNKEAAELVLAAVSQANQLSAMVNESLRISEDESSTSTTGNPAPPSTPSSGNTVSPGNKMPGVPSVKLQVIANSLNTHLTQLLNLMSERDEERERLRKELQRSRDQLHAMHEASQKSSSRHRSADDPLPPIPSQVATQVSESATSSGGVTPEPSALQTEESAELPEYEQPLEVTPPCTSQATPPSIPETTPPSIPETTPPVEAPPPDATTSVADEVT